MKWGVWAIPPSKGIYSDLKPRFQMWRSDEIFTYDSESEAQKWADSCNNDRNGWTYLVKIIEEKEK